jgi:hypothetical protein
MITSICLTTILVKFKPQMEMKTNPLMGVMHVELPKDTNVPVLQVQAIFLVVGFPPPPSLCII